MNHFSICPECETIFDMPVKTCSCCGFEDRS